ncbi:MAG: hypothetical protein KUG81_05455, partial [Gammaproteobacteria bacterium]|nr:hypothetical protein [Gammaproteobacteria bacterium]
MSTSGKSLHEGYGEIAGSHDGTRLQDYLVILLRQKRLIAFITAVIVVVTVAWIGTRTPRYQARATLLLEKDEAAGGVLSELASLTSEPAAQAEIALITSRSLATVTASRPNEFNTSDATFRVTEPDFDPFARTGGDEQEQGAASAMERMALDVVVERHDLRPSEGIRRRVTGGELHAHRLYAWMDKDPNFEGEPVGSLAVAFVSEGDQIQVQVGHGSRLTRTINEAESFAYEAGGELRYGGWILRLHGAGQFVGESYSLSYRSRERTIDALMGTVQAIETGRKTNVVYVFVDGSDPAMAAETANAICKNYIRRNVGIGRQKATQTVRFIDAQLNEQLESLQAAERKVVEIQTEYPETIALSVAAEALIEQMSAIELQHTQDKLALRVIEEALGYLEEGDFEALARLGAHLPNLMALEYIKELALLEAESLRLDRSDVVGYKLLLTTEMIRLQGLADMARAEAARLEQGLAALQKGDLSGIAQVGGTLGDASFGEYLMEVANLDAEVSRMRATSTEANPQLKAALATRVELGKRLAQQVQGALEGVRTSVASYEELVDSYKQNIEFWPQEERGTIDHAVATLRQRVRASLGAQAEGLSDRLRSGDDVRLDIQTRL